MTVLLIPISAIGSDGFTVEERVPVSSLQPLGVKPVPVSEVRVSGRFTPLGSEYLFRGTIFGEFESACYRCLSSARTPFESPVTWLFREGRSPSFVEAEHLSESDVGEDDETLEQSLVYEGPHINLAPHVWEEIVFSVPSHHLCGDACKGLCPRCGVNLNNEVCACQAQEESGQTARRGLAVLAEMFPHLAPKSTKE